MARLRNHLWFEGMTNQGACSVLHLLERVFEGLGVGVPERALGVVALADLPVAGRIVDALLEAPQLLLGIDVEVELEDVGAVVVQHLLEVVDVLVALRPDRLRHHLVHALHQHVLVVGAVEDRHLPAAGACWW